MQIPTGNYSDDWKEEIISTATDPRGFEIRVIEWQHGGLPANAHKEAFTLEGYYIGTVAFAIFLYKRGIKPEVISPEHKVCSIGYCEPENKYYGWSHRAMYGFGIGDAVEEGDCTAVSGWSDEYLAVYPEDDLSLPIGFKANTKEDCRRMAIAYAENMA